MHRSFILKLLENYDPSDIQEKTYKAKTIQFVKEHANCFSRQLEIGHITGSGWVLNEDMSKVLLTHHLKLNKWLQLGGHSDDDYNTLEVVIREIEEESGIRGSDLIQIVDGIFDIGVHVIPRHGSEKEHIHYGIRFVFKTKSAVEIVRQEEESKELRWVSLEDVHNYSNSRDMLRMVNKTLLLKK